MNNNAQCSAGCMSFTGGEIKHTQGCVFYPESLTEYNFKKQEELTSRYIEAEKFILEYLETPWYLRFSSKKIRKFLESRSKYDF